MRTVAIMATFPAREATFPKSAESIASQVDRLTIVLNEYTPDDRVPDLPSNVELIYPPEDLKDTGKFFAPVDPQDLVVLCDDDIDYPVDYVSVMRSHLMRYEHMNAVVGVHGVTYGDFFDGDPLSRVVHVFTQALSSNCFVNQLGTGTVMCRGYQMPTFEFMRGSARFVDLRFARHCATNKYPHVCVAREKDWMTEFRAGPSLFETFTKSWPLEIVKEAQEIAGFRHLPRPSLLGN